MPQPRWKRNGTFCTLIMLIIFLSGFIYYICTTDHTSSSNRNSINVFHQDNKPSVHHHGMRKSAHPSHHQSSPSLTGASTTHTDDDAGSTSSAVELPENTTFIETEKNANNFAPNYTTGLADEEYVKPSKVHDQPLHEDDLLYESKKVDPTADGKPVHQTTGQYRNASSRIWDPHPQYTINAFGLAFHLVLSQEIYSINKNPKITHVWPNKTLRIKEEHRDHEKVLACNYNGRVRNDEKSSVKVSLCGGMRGIIRTSRGNFYIEPVENYTSENTNVLHKITRETVPPATLQGAPCEAGKVHIHDDILVSSESDYILAHTNNYNETRSERRRRSTSPNIKTNDYTMEVLIAVDRKMQEYHGKDITKYVSTLMSTVSSIYSDASIGNSINVAVVHILVLQQDLVVESNSVGHHNSPGVSASHMLARFCKFIKRYNQHHDTALLLTREEICRNTESKKCDTLGLAELGTMCKPSSCSIVQDNGLSAAFTIAHELGHVLNMPHDDESKCDRFRKEGRTHQHVMSRMLDHNTHPWSWSDCSRHYVTEFLENGHGNCMLGKPETDIIESDDNDQMLAGEKFTYNQQCELVFGSGSKICSYMPRCVRLWCAQDAEERTGCLTQHMPWADGTNCGDDKNDKWCQKGKCVPQNRTALIKIDGDWGGWSHYGECSRSCGGGVQSSRRECNAPRPANGGRYCTGERVRYRSCNTLDCPDSHDFREEQCVELNNNNFGISGLSNDVRWVPKYGIPEPGDFCKLYCRVKSSNNYFLLNEKVKDGTPCTHDSFNKCVNGICREAGCDNHLNSSAKLDKCGVCEGRNNTCYDVAGNFSYNRMEELKAQGRSSSYYYSVTVIPRGSANIEIVQPGYTDDLNYIALRDDRGIYILNGNNLIIQYPKVFAYGGVTFEYTGTNSSLERINTTFARRLKKDLHVEILSVRRMDLGHRQDLMRYSFTVAQNEDTFFPHKRVYKYEWRMADWSECDQLCEGKQYRSPACYQLEDGQIVAPTSCHNLPEPSTIEQKCNTDCAVEWKVHRSECSVPCGRGILTVNSTCMQIQKSSGVTTRIDDSYCAPSGRVSEHERCNGLCLSAIWSYSPWEPCSRSCGGGITNRTVLCLTHYGGYKIEHSYCKYKRQEPLEMRCREEPCPVWGYGENTPCSVSCGVGNRTRAIFCKQNNQLVNSALCSSLSRPAEIVTNCTMGPCHRKDPSVAVLPLDGGHVQTRTRPFHVYNAIPQHYPSSTINSYRHIKWRTGTWGLCSATCGSSGFKARTVYCLNQTSHEIVDDRYCNEYERPLNTTNCEASSCPKWNHGAFGECRDDCKRQRLVVCEDGKTQVNNALCPADKAPAEWEYCCQYKYRKMWGKCSATCETGVGVKKNTKTCVRLLPKSETNPNPFKTSVVVDEKFCAKIVFKQMSKRCRVSCATWKIDGYTKCSVGCGQGLMFPLVKCMSGRNVVDGKLCTGKKPSMNKSCSSVSHCLWKSDRWKPCSCSGITKRRVQCYDRGMRRLSTSCPESKKPIVKQTCRPPPNCSCRGLREREYQRDDREYPINVHGRNISIYCHKMNTSDPTEYLTLRAGSERNYAKYYNKRTSDREPCSEHARRKEFVDPNLPYGSTHFSKVRIKLPSLHIIVDDFNFATTNGPKAQRFGSAGDCYAPTGQCPKGRFAIDLSGTGFKIHAKKTHWTTSGQDPAIWFTKKLEYPFQHVEAQCGGYCGGCAPSDGTSVQLEISDNS